MSVRALMVIGGVSIAMVLPGVCASSATAREADAIFGVLRVDSRQALFDADTLQSFSRQPGPSWTSDAIPLDDLRDAINDMGAKLYRLETIGPRVDPWQQRLIDRVAVSIQLMADNVHDAIVFGNVHQTELWLPTYRRYVDNLFQQAQNLTRSVGDLGTRTNP